MITVIAWLDSVEALRNIGKIITVTVIISLSGVSLSGKLLSVENYIPFDCFTVNSPIPSY